MPPKSLLTMTLSGQIQVSQQNQVRPLKIQPGNQYQRKAPEKTIMNHLYRPMLQPFVLVGSDLE